MAKREMIMKLVLVLLGTVVSLLAAACTAPAATPTPTPKTVTFGALEKAGVGTNSYPTLPPGQTSPLPRAYPGAPPRIPHDVSALTITVQNNPCLGCHQVGLEVAPGHRATKIPDSHYTDLASGQKGDSLVGARYYCRTCHTPQSAEEPAVGNSSGS